MAYDRLALYNNALRILGERSVASLTEAREPRYLLDAVWNEGGVDLCLEEGQWNFAMRAVRIDYDPTISPDFGYARGFSKPSDWIRTSAFCSDEFFKATITAYSDEPDYWYCDLDLVYVKYVSNDAAFGGDMNRWPRTFCRYVASHFALEVASKVTTDKEKLAQAEGIWKRRKADALNKDAMNQPPAQPASTSWVRNRAGSGSTRRDGGSRGSLIG